MDVIELPQNIELEYLAEGAANIVYRFHIPPPSPSITSDLLSEGNHYGQSTPPPTELPPLHFSPVLQEKLLRIRKDLATRVPVIETQQSFENLIKPLFPEEHLVDQLTARLPKGLIERCNIELRRMETARTRSAKRHGVYLSEEEDYGTLVMDMSTHGQKELICIEFKPKWLAQSPSAPYGARKCRTCALRAMRAQQNGPTGISQDSFCPLALIHKDQRVLAMVVDSILQESKYPSQVLESLRPRVVDFLEHSPLLKRLQELQMELDPKGVFAADTSTKAYLTVMTLRDCTVFLRV